MKIDFKNSKSIIFFIATFLFLYTSARAYLLSITWDEAYSYIEFVRNGKVFLDKLDTMSANNHLINTWLMILFTKIFGIGEFVLRIPSLIAHLLFLIFSAKLLFKYEKHTPIVFAFIILNVNPYMLDFFSLARGYGLSISMMMISLYYLSQFISTEKKYFYATLTSLFSIIGLFSNFVLLNYCLIIHGLLFLFLIFYASNQKSKKVIYFLKGVFSPLIILSFGLYLSLPIIFELKDVGALFFGGTRSFWADTMSTITDRCFYELGYNYWFQRIAKGFVFLILISAIIFIIIKAAKKEYYTNLHFLISIIVIIGGCSVATIVQHYFLDTLYLLDRTALFLVVLFNVLFVVFITQIATEKKYYKWVLFISSSILILHFIFSFNLSYVLEWKLDANTKHMLSDLNKVKELPKEKENISIGISLVFDPAINYYREKNNLTWLNTAWRYEPTNVLHDYFCLTESEWLQADKNILELIKQYPITKNVLAKRKLPVKEIKQVLIMENNFEKNENKCFYIDQSTEYGPAFSQIINDSLIKYKMGIIESTIDVNAPSMNKNNLSLVISFQNKKGEAYSWQKAYIKDYIKEKNNWYHVSFSCIIPQESTEGDEIKSYIWNADEQTVYIKNMKFKWLAYKF